MTCSRPLNSEDAEISRPEAVRRFVDEQRSGQRDWSMQIWQFLTLELWMQVFLDGRAQEFETRDAPVHEGSDRKPCSCRTETHNTTAVHGGKHGEIGRHPYIYSIHSSPGAGHLVV